MMVRDNFVHGDLHGGNILYSMSDDHVTVLDCGIATSLDKRTFAPFGTELRVVELGLTGLIGLIGLTLIFLVCAVVHSSNLE